MALLPRDREIRLPDHDAALRACLVTDDELQRSRASATAGAAELEQRAGALDASRGSDTASGTGMVTALLAATAAPAPFPAVTEHVTECPSSAVCSV